MEAKKNERVWVKNQSSGDIDDARLIEGITGERAIYKKRGEIPPEMGAFQELPKRMNFVFDLSARFVFSFFFLKKNKNNNFIPMN